MLSVESAVARFRRDMTRMAIVRGLLIVAIVAAMMVNWLSNIAFGGIILLVAVFGVWVALSYRSARGSRVAAESPSLIAAGQYDQAEQRIEEALNAFSIFRQVKVLSLHHLALLRHAQKRWQESAILCRVLLGQRLGTLQTLTKPSRLMLASSLLEMHDLRGAYEALAGLHSQRLNLNEALHLLSVQVDYEAAVGAWEQMLPRGWEMKRIELCELMPPAESARAQAMLALAALKSGRSNWTDWLRRRIELMTDAAELCRERPILAELWPAPSPAAEPGAQPGPQTAPPIEPQQGVQNAQASEQASTQFPASGD